MEQTKVKHVIFVMLENRTFDQIFGYRNDYNFPYKVNGIKNCNEKDETLRDFNFKMNGDKVYLNPINAFTGEDDSSHDLTSTLFAINNEKMKGFVKANELNVKDSSDGEKSWSIPDQDVMSYFPKNSFPVFEYIADNFMICDNWFSSVPAMTIPNRVFALCGTSNGHVDNSVKNIYDEIQEIVYDIDTIFDRLNENNISWKIYYHDISLTLVLEHQLHPKNLQNYSIYKNFESDIKSNNLPSFSFIEPEFGIESSTCKINDVNNGETLVYNIIKSLQENEEIWNSSLLVITYDEGGGFYDHVYPPKTFPPFDEPEIVKGSVKYTFDQYGLRVPTMLVSPLLDIGVDHTLYDHTSLLNFLEYNWNLKYLTNRDKNANNFVSKLRESPRNDINKIIDVDIEISNNHSTTIRNRPKDFNFVKETLEYYFLGTIVESSKILEDMKKYLF